MPTGTNPHGPRSDDLMDLIARAGAGCEDAARILYEQHSNAILRVIRRRMRQDSPLRDLLDSADLTQETWQHVFTAVRDRAFASPEHFLRFIQAVANRRFAEYYRNWVVADKRSLTHEVPLNSAQEPPSAGTDPAAAAEAADQMAHLLAQLPPNVQALVRAIRDGECAAAAAARLRVPARLAQRVVQRFRLNAAGVG